MNLVHSSREKEGALEVAWTWMPFWLASNPKLILDVDSALLERYRGRKLDQGCLEEMGETVIETIISHHPIAGLEGLLRAITGVMLEERA